MKKIFSLLLVLVTLLGVSALVSQESYAQEQNHTHTFTTPIGKSLDTDYKLDEDGIGTYRFTLGSIAINGQIKWDATHKLLLGSNKQLGTIVINLKDAKEISLVLTNGFQVLEVVVNDGAKTSYTSFDALNAALSSIDEYSDVDITISGGTSSAKRTGITSITYTYDKGGSTDPEPVDKYSVSFNSNGGSTVADIIDVEVNTKITEPSAPTKDNHDFVGWYKDETLNDVWDFDVDTVTSNITLYAKWELKTIPSPEVYDFHETFENTKLTSSYADGAFTGANGTAWSYVHSRNEDTYGIEGGGILLRRSDEPSKLEVIFTNGISKIYFEYRKAYTGNSNRTYNVDILVNSVKETSLVLDTSEFSSGADETVFSFFHEGDYEGLVTVRIYATGNTGNQQLVIDNFKWSENTGGVPQTKHAVTFDSLEGSAVPTQNVIEGQNVVEPAVPTKPGFTFVGWYLDETLFDFDTPITAPITLTAKWEEVQPISILEARALAVGTDVYVRGVVTSHHSNGGYTLEDATGAISLYIPGNNTWANDLLGKEVTLTGKTDTYEGLIQIGSVTVVKVAENTNASIPNILTIEDLSTLDISTQARLYNIQNLTVESVSGSTTLTIVLKDSLDNKITLRKVNDVVIDAELSSLLQNLEVGDVIHLSQVVSGWYKEEQLSFSNITSLEKVVEPNKYTVTFDTDGGTAVDALVDVIEDSKITVPAAPTKENHTFVGWYKEETLNNIWDFDVDTVTSNITLYAKWEEDVVEPNKYTVTFDTDGGTAVDALVDVIEDSKITVPVAPTKENHTFVGWYKEETLNNIWDFDVDTVTSNITLYAKWEENVIEPKTYQVSITYLKDNLVSLSYQRVIEENHSFRFVFLQDEAYDFVYFIVNGKVLDVASDHVFLVDKDITLIAIYQLKENNSAIFIDHEGRPIEHVFAVNGEMMEYPSYADIIVPEGYKIDLENPFVDLNGQPFVNELTENIIYKLNVVLIETPSPQEKRYLVSKPSSQNQVTIDLSFRKKFEGVEA